MWWSRSLRSIAAAAALAAALPLAGCSFTPVYGGSSPVAAKPVVAFNYAAPKTRIEQVIYRELALRLGESDAPGAPVATVAASLSAVDPSIGAAVNVADTRRATVRATLTITWPDGRPPTTYTRVATADYTSPTQVLAQVAAADEAAERAARAAAESLRLAVLADLTR